MFDLHKIFNITSTAEFNATALEIFQFQAQNNPVYKSFLHHLGVNPLTIKAMGNIPFLPIELFKSQPIYCSTDKPELYFTSSGTTGSQTSFHYIEKPELYEESILNGFASFFGHPQKYCILGLLPGYMERKESSLVYMVNYLQNLSGHPLNGNFLTDFDELANRLKQLEENGQAVLLFGVSFALLDFGVTHPMKLTNTTLIETGGMKGRKKEMTREELHQQLQLSFGSQCRIVSEYGMTELLSQAWMFDQHFECPPWMKVVVRDKTDPLKINLVGSGGLNLIDLANVLSCSFIASGDAGICYENGSFDVLGRLDHHDLRGCNLLYT